MDEPLSSLDAALRTELRVELVELQRRLGVSFLYVTHDQTEAMTMADRIAVMLNGRVAQIGTPSQIYGDPRHLDIAKFIGTPAINVLPATTDSDGRLIVLGQFQPLRVPNSAGSDLVIAIRPEHLEYRRIGQDAAAPDNLVGSVRHVEHLGHEAMIQLSLATQPNLTLSVRVGQARLHDALSLAPQEQVALHMAMGAPLVFDGAGDRVPAIVMIGHEAGRAAAS
ncbi:TOBE domain-containing protein [Inquilinus sp. NPDC058860]|uniref:TOBE domain-containing protein n=1 Tax=Inquilinus sp. NPDC058860 TaxID=3346652 RepID=UPI0036B9AEAA